MATCFSRSVLLPAILLLGTLPAQNTVGFSFDGTWHASGRTSETNPSSAPSYVSLTVKGFPEVQVRPIPRGASASDVAYLCILALAQAGFHVTVEGPTKFRVTGHVSGRPIGGGGAIGENDDDMRGSDLDVVLGSVAFGAQPGSAPTEQGYGIARPTGSTPSQGGTIVTTLEFEGSTTPTVIAVNVPPGSLPQQIEMMMFQAFVQHGITPRPWAAPHLFQPSATQPLFGLTRDHVGRRVSHVQFEPLIETEIIAMHLQSCMPIAVGVAEYGWSWPAFGSMHLDSASHPRIGAPLQIDLQTGLPFSFAGLVVGFTDWSLPLPQLLNGTPAPAYDGPTLFVQPVGSTIAGFTNGAGELHYSLFVPADPAFVGAPLRWQGFDIGAPGPTTVWLSNGLMTNVGP
jgi:hypothetical protein